MNRRGNKCSYLLGIVQYTHKTICLSSAVICPITCKPGEKKAEVLKIFHRDLFCKILKIILQKYGGKINFLFTFFSFHPAFLQLLVFLCITRLKT